LEIERDRDDPVLSARRIPPHGGAPEDTAPRPTWC